MKDPLKPRDKITQKMTRDGAIAENQTTGDTERISKRTQDADFQKSPEQQAAQLQGAASPTSPLPHVPGAAPKADTGKTERVMEHIDAAHTRKASKKAVRKAQAEATAGTKSSRLQFTDEERAAPELEKYIKKSDKAADRFRYCWHGGQADLHCCTALPPCGADRHGACRGADGFLCLQ